MKDFINRLKRAAVKCDFGSHLDRALRNQFLAGLSDGATRKEILAKPAADIRSFQEVSKIATARETAVKAAAQLASSSIVVSSSSSVNAVSQAQEASIEYNCCRCKGRFMHQQPPQVFQLRQRRTHRTGRQLPRERSSLQQVPETKPF